MSTKIQSGGYYLRFKKVDMSGAGVVLSCHEAKYQPIADIIKAWPNDPAQAYDF